MKIKVVPQSVVLSFIWPLAIIVVVFVYLHGIGGPFLFDDFANLDALGAHGGVNDWKSLWLYLAQGDSGPTGRPISLLSFLIDDNSWPSNPSGFKYTNILIHALNGCLLFGLLLTLLRQKSLGFSERQSFFIAVVGSFLWVAHPMFVSTVLYVVQRMAMLSATFLLAGLLSHVYFRSLIVSRPKLAYAGMAGGMGFWGLLAILSKENGVLLPVLILVLEVTICSRAASLNRLWKVAFLLLPTICILGYLVYLPLKHGFFSEWLSRGFSPYERLLTESRIIWEYLLNLFTFRGAGSGLFSDDYPVSRSLVSPLSTIFSLLAIVFSVIVAVLKRNKWPLISLACIFYICGHLVESTSVGLELYFEHRNYLPSIFLFVPVAWLLVRLQGWLRPVGISTIVLTAAFLLFIRVDLWSNNVSLALAWSKDAPTSVRAQRSAAIALSQAGYPEQALGLLDRAYHNNPASHAILLHRMLLKCSLGNSVEADKISLLDIARVEPFNPKLTNLMEVFVSLVRSGGCSALDANYAKELFAALMDNPVAKKSDGFRHQLFYFLGNISSHENRATEAKSNFSHSLSLRPKAGAFMQSLAVLASDGHCSSALELAEAFRGPLIDNGAMPSMTREYYQKELELLLDDIRSECSVGLN